MTTDGGHAPFGPAQEFAAEFLRRAEPALRDIFARWNNGRLESLTLHQEQHPDTGDITLHATAVVEFRGARYTSTRTVWPASHPAPLQAGIHATMLEERLLTRRHHPLPGTEPPVEL